MLASSRTSAAGSAASSRRSRSRSAFSVSACECTDTYSPAAIDMAPATSPATAVIKMVDWLACAAATLKGCIQTCAGAPSQCSRPPTPRRAGWCGRLPRLGMVEALMIRMVLRLGLALLVPCAGGTVPGRRPTAAPRCPRRRLPAKRRAGARAVPTHIGTTGRRVHTGIFACGATRLENFHLRTPRRAQPPLFG